MLLIKESLFIRSRTNKRTTLQEYGCTDNPHCEHLKDRLRNQRDHIVAIGNEAVQFCVCRH